MRYLLLFLAIPGSLTLIAYAIRSALQMVRSWKEDAEDQARILRIQREYCVPELAIEEPKGRRTPPRELPEIASRYDREVSR